MLIKFKRGLAASLPALQAGEPALTTDTKMLYIGTDGTTGGNFAVGNMLKSVYDANGDGVVDDSARLNNQLPSYYLNRDNLTGVDYSTMVNPLGGAANLAIVSVASKVVTVDGDKTGIITTSQKLQVIGSAVNDGIYTITAVALNVDVTEITVSEAITDQGAVGSVSAGPLMSLQQADIYNSNAISAEAVARAAADSALDGRISSIENGTLNSEAVQDIVGAMVTDSSTLDFSYDDTTGTITAIVIDDSITAAKIAADVAGAALVQNGTSGALDVNVDDSTIEINTDALRVKDGGIVEAKLGTGAVTEAKIGTGAVTEAKIGTGAVTADKLGADSVTAAKINPDVAGSALVANGTSGALDVNVDDSTIEVNADALRVKDGGIATAKLADDSVTAAKINVDVAGLGIVANGTSGALDVNVGNGIEIDTDTVTVKLDGSSLAKSAAGLKVSALDADSVTLSNIELDNFKTGVIKTVLNAESDSAILTEKAVKDYVDAVAQGLAVHVPVKVATTAALTAAYDNGTSGVGATLTNTGTQEALTLDGVAVTVGMRVLVKDQAAALQNGIYIVSTIGDGSTNWVLTRAGDFDNAPSSEIHDGDFFFVQDGTTQADNGYVQTELDPIVVGTDAVNFSQFSGAGQIIDGSALSKTGNVLDVNVDDSTIEVNADALRVKDGGIVEAKLATGAVTADKLGADSVTAAKINPDVAGSALVANGTSGALDVNVDDSTIEVNADAIRVKDAGITAAKLAADSVTAVKINADVAGAALVQNGTSGALDVNVDDSTIEVNADAIRVKDGGIVEAKLGAGSVTEAKIGTGAVTADKLGSGAVTADKLGADSVTAAKINPDVAGAGLVANGTSGALDVNVGNTTVITSDAVEVKFQASDSVTLSSDASGLKADVNVDDSTIKINTTSNYIYVDLVDGGTF